MRNDHSLNGISCRNKSLDLTCKIRLYAHDTFLKVTRRRKKIKEGFRDIQFIWSYVWIKTLSFKV